MVWGFLPVKLADIIWLRKARKIALKFSNSWMNIFSSLKLSLGKKKKSASQGNNEKKKIADPFFDIRRYISKAKLGTPDGNTYRSCTKLKVEMFTCSCCWTFDFWWKIFLFHSILIFLSFTVRKIKVLHMYFFFLLINTKKREYFRGAYLLYWPLFHKKAGIF